jgi:SARP family transcriptional regulator, regulator of embCAB operon
MATLGRRPNVPCNEPSESLTVVGSAQGDLMVKDNDVQFELNLFENWRLLHGKIEVRVASRQQRLISALAIHGPRNRRFLSGLLWPDSPEARALESLRVSMHLISRQVPGLLVVGGPTLSLTDSLSVDLHQCLAQVRNCEQIDSVAAENACFSQLLHAELLPGWYEDWVVLEQNRLQNFRLQALVWLARRWLDRGEAEKAAAAAQSALDLEPLHEACVGLLMHAELKMGNRAGALHAFESFSGNLWTELGLGPSEYLGQIAADIRGNHR